jgi:hypothetical protein
MKYLLTVYGESSTWGTLSEEETKAELAAFDAFEREASEARVLIDSGALTVPAYRVSVREGARHISEGPPSDDDRRLGCFYILDCDDAGEVTEWAAKIPLVGRGGFDTIEIWPVMDDR